MNEQPANLGLDSTVAPTPAAAQPLPAPVAAVATPPALPANAPPAIPACANCGKPLGETVYRISDRTVCQTCGQAIAKLQDLNRFAGGPWMTGAMLGLGAAIISGAIWAILVKATDRQFGLVAIGIGIFVSRAVMRGAGGRRGPSIQTLSILLSLLGVVIGKGLIASWARWDETRTALGIKDHETIFRAVTFCFGALLYFSPLDLLWYGLAVWEAWRYPRAIRIPISGPYAPGQTHSAPVTATPSGGLQFDTVQPKAPQ